MVDLNPFDNIGDSIAGMVQGAAEKIMAGLWGLGMRVIELEFKVIGAFSTPDLTGSGSVAHFMPLTMEISAAVALVMMFGQLMVALWRRDGGGLVHLVLGMVQYGLVYVGCLAVCKGLVDAASALERAIVQATFHVDGMAQLQPSQVLHLSKDLDSDVGVGRAFADFAMAVGLGFTSLIVIVPAGLLGIMVGLTRNAALMILVITLPITAAGLLHQGGASRMFWRAARWFLAALLITPNMALVFGIAAQLGLTVVNGAGTSTANAVGTAVVAGVLMLMAGFVPVPLFRLFAWVEPENPSGQQMRQAWADARGGRAGRASGGDQASKADEHGRPPGEHAAEGTTGSRFGQLGAAIRSKAAALPGAGTLAAGAQLASAGAQKVGSAADWAMNNKAMNMASSIANGARNLQSDVLGGSGAGDGMDQVTTAPGPRAGRAGHRPRTHDNDQDGGDRDDGGRDDGGRDDSAGNGGSPPLQPNDVSSPPATGGAG